MFITETANDLSVNHVSSNGAAVRLTVRESAATGEDLLVGPGKSVVAGGGTVTLLVGDDVTIGGLVQATDDIFIRGPLN